MKMLFAECCGSIVVPGNAAFDARSCRCGRSRCWWDDPTAGRFGCYSSLGIDAVSVLGLHNGLLRESFQAIGVIQGDAMRRIIDETPDNYIFKQAQSLIIRFKPGFSNDTRFIEKSEDIPRG